MNRIKQIKAAQIAAASDQGQSHPYKATESVKPMAKADKSNKPLGRLQQIKAAQQEMAEENGLENPYVVGVDMASGPDKSVTMEVNDLAHYQTALDVDIGKIAAHSDLLEKAKVKQSVLPTYLPFVDAYVESGDNYPNTVAVQCMIWLFDIAEIEHALNLAFHLVKQDQKMPNKFERNMPSFVSDVMFDIANALLKEDQGISPYLDAVIAVAEKDKWDMPVVCFSKLYSMLAKHKVREGELEQALALCKKNIEINPEKHGVKGLTADIEKALLKKDPDKQS